MPLHQHRTQRPAVTFGLIALLSLAAPRAPAADCDRACQNRQANARLQRMEDEQAIERLLQEYGRTLDNRDFAAYSKLFAENGEWKGGLGSYKGPATIQAAMEKIFANANTDIPRGKNFHVMSNFIIDVQGDRATARSLFVFYQMDGNKPNASLAGRYEDILIRENGAWRFLERLALPPG
jgi:uncharacterized protein (TIGR02246 family)